MIAIDAVAEFEASMPAAYHDAFDAEAIAAHAGVAYRREGSATRCEIWKDLPERIVAICIITGDRPGLLSQISAALVAHEIDVVTAHAYCRTRSDGALQPRRGCGSTTAPVTARWSSPSRQRIDPVCSSS